MQNTTFPRLLLDHARRRPQAPALREKEYGIWQTLNWHDLLEMVRAIAGGFCASGLQAGQHVIVVDRNSVV